MRPLLTVSTKSANSLTLTSVSLKVLSPSSYVTHSRRAFASAGESAKTGSKTEKAADDVRVQQRKAFRDEIDMQWKEHLRQQKEEASERFKIVERTFGLAPCSHEVEEMSKKIDIILGTGNMVTFEMRELNSITPEAKEILEKFPQALENPHEFRKSPEFMKLVEDMNRESYRVNDEIEEKKSGYIAAPPTKYTSTLHYLPYIYTPKTKMEDLTMADAGLFFNIDRAFSPEELKRVFPIGVNSEWSALWNAMEERFILLRPTTIKLIRHLERMRITTGEKLRAAGSVVFDEPSQLTSKDLDIRDADVNLGTYSALQLDVPDLQHNATDFSQQLPHRIIVGPAQIGKTAILNSVILYARSNGWLVFDYIHTYYALNDSVRCQLNPKTGLYENPDIAYEILSDFLASEGPKLKTIKQRGTYPDWMYLPEALDVVVHAERTAIFAKEEAELNRLIAIGKAEGREYDPATYVSSLATETYNRDRSEFTLYDMVAWSLKHYQYSFQVLVSILDELKKVEEYPVLMAIDGLNNLWEKTSYFEAITGRNLRPDELGLVHELTPSNIDGFKESHRLKRGMWLTTVSFKHDSAMSMFKQVDFPLETRIPVGPMSKYETFTALKYFHATRQFKLLKQIDVIDNHTVDFFGIVSGGRFSDLFLASVYTPTFKPRETLSTHKFPEGINFSLFGNEKGRQGKPKKVSRRLK